MASIDNDMAVASCYRVRVQLGKGNFSSVYLAEHIDTVHSESSPLVVLKVPQPSVMARFGVADFELKLARKEIANLRRNQFTSNSALNADGFAKLLLPDDAIGSGQLGYAALLFTDLCGPSVFEYTRGLSGTHLPWAKAQQTIADVVDALLFLHANGIGHGDLQTRNLLLNTDPPISTLHIDTVLSYIQARRPFVDKHPEDLQDTDAQPMLSFFQKHDITLSGTIKLVDFGGAFLAADGGKGDSIRRDVAAPERLEGEPWGLPADIWALGCTILELVTGERLFHLNHIPLQERTDGHSIELTRKRLGADETDTAHLKQVVRKVVDRRSVSGVTPAELDVIKEIGVGTLRWRPEDRMDIYEVQRIWKARDTSRGVS